MILTTLNEIEKDISYPINTYKNVIVNVSDDIFDDFLNEIYMDFL